MNQVPTTTMARYKALETAGFQFLKDKAGWSCYDTDNRQEVPGVRHKYLGEVVWLTYLKVSSK